MCCERSAVTGAWSSSHWPLTCSPFFVFEPGKKLPAGRERTTLRIAADRLENPQEGVRL